MPPLWKATLWKPSQSITGPQPSYLLRNGCFVLTIASLADVYLLKQSATDWQDKGVVNFPVRADRHVWENRAALWVLCMQWWMHLCHLHTSQPLHAGSPRCMAQSSPVSLYCFSSPRNCSAQTAVSQTAPETVSGLCFSLASAFCRLNFVVYTPV